MQGGAGAYRTRLRFPGERIRRSGLGEMILFRYNSETQFCHDAPVAQLDRVLGYEPRGWEFDSLRAHHPTNLVGAKGGLRSETPAHRSAYSEAAFLIRFA